ncbi:MAG: glycosyltransferase, partial [Bacteroidota bacterium]
QAIFPFETAPCGRCARSLELHRQVSVIIPCYNDGQYLLEAVESVKCHEDEQFYEIIIVNDGSTDPFTLEVFDKCKAKGCRLIHQKNAGVAAARNTGIRVAKGKYVLPLDSDNKLLPEYMNSGFQIMEKDAKVAVVYGNPIFFGDELRTWKVKAFDMDSLFISNYIDNCAVIRKSALEEINGYDEDREIMGWADWDLWMRLAARGWKFHYINAFLFHYRLRKDSMINKYSKEEMDAMRKYLFSKPEYHLIRLYREKVIELKRYNHSLTFLTRQFFSVLWEKINRKLAFQQSIF